MKASEWIDRVKKARGWDSDYRVAKELGFRPSTIGNYRAHGTPMDEEIAIKVANALGEKPEAVLLDQFAERVKNPEVSSTIQKMASNLSVYYVKSQNAIKSIASFAMPLRSISGFTV